MCLAISHLLTSNYCESTIIHGVPIFVVLVGRPKNVYPVNLKTMNSKIHELLFLLQSTKISIHELKYIHNMTWNFKEVYSHITIS